MSAPLSNKYFNRLMKSRKHTNYLLSRFKTMSSFARNEKEGNYALYALSTTSAP